MSLDDPRAAAAPEPDALYVGYLPAAPKRTALWMRRVAPALLAGGAALAALLALLQQPADPGLFEYGVVRPVAGTVVERPYPMLIAAEGPDGAGAVASLLVRPGKHGAAADVAGLEGRRVRLGATRIASPLGSMLELVPGTVEQAAGDALDPLPGAWGHAPRGVASGRIAVVGEIVDSKCFLGVMKPGRGKPHRSCAARCLSGGIPPQLLIEVADGSRRLLLLAHADGSALEPSEVRDLVGEPVEAEGIVERRAGVLLLRVDSAGLRRAHGALP